MASVERSQQGGDTGSGVGECPVPLEWQSWVLMGRPALPLASHRSWEMRPGGLTSTSIHQKSWYSVVASFSIVLFEMSA